MIYDWSDDTAPRGPNVRVTIDGRELTHIIRCDTEAGWLERYVTDEVGKLKLVTIDGEPEVAREKLFGEVKVEMGA